MAIDTTAILEKIDVTQEQVYTRVQGIANLSNFKNLSDTERESIATQAATYQKEYEALQLGHSIFEQLPLSIDMELWEAMRDSNIEFLEKLKSATTYEDWKIVFALAEKWFDLMREIVQDDVWTALLGNGIKFFQSLTELGGIATLPVMTVPASMIATLDRVTNELLAAKASFTPEVIIATKMTLEVSEEEPIS